MTNLITKCHIYHQRKISETKYSPFYNNYFPDSNDKKIKIDFSPNNFTTQELKAKESLGITNNETFLYERLHT